MPGRAPRENFLASEDLCKTLDLICRRYGGWPSARLGYSVHDPIGYALDTWIAWTAESNEWDPPLRTIQFKHGE